MSQRMSQLDVDRQNAKVFNASMKEDKPESPWIGKESELHSQIEDYLKMNRFYYIHSRTDKRSTNNIGTPDFVICGPNGSTWFVEVKRKNGKLSKEQTVVRHILLALGHKYAVIHSMTEMIYFINQQ